MTRGAWWPVAIVGVLGVTVVANGILLWAASDPQGSALEPDYYARGVRWDSTLAARRASDALGWSGEARVIARPGEELEIRVALEDAAGAPLDGATVRIEAIHNAEAATPWHATLEARGAGVYAARIASRRAGLWEVRVEAARTAASGALERYLAVERTEATRARSAE
jgi:nitrogen fixation protein FixH